MLKNLTTALLAVLIAAAAPYAAEAADVTLRMGHLWPAVAGPHKDLLQVWADTVESESNGRIAVEVYPAATLAKPPAQYEAVKSRIMDVTATVLGYTANRFPLTQMVELPGLAKNAVHGSCIVQSLYDEGALTAEFADTRPLFLFAHGPGLLHTKDKLIKEPGDLAGMRVRRPTTVVAGLLEQLNAQPVGMPAPSAYPAMQRGVIDGVAFPWEGALSFRLNELADKHTEMGGLYTLTFIVTLNKDVYDGLADDLKAVIDNNSGKAWAAKAGTLFDALDVKGRAQAEEAGHAIHVIEGGIENPAWKPAIDAAIEAYLADLEGKGLPARELYARAREIGASCQ